MNKALLMALPLAFTLQASAQQGGALTEKDYERAERALSYGTDPYIDRASVRPTWVAGTNKFWYRVLTAQGSEFILVDASNGTRTPAFDHAKLASAISSKGVKANANALPFNTFTFSSDNKAIVFRAGDKQWKADLNSYELTEDSSRPVGGRSAGGFRGRGGMRGIAPGVTSPDGKLEAFIKDDNLWVRQVGGGKQTQLTTDGVKDFGYATDNAGWSTSDKPVLRWSPDSKKIATFKQDQRKVGEWYLVNTKVGHPELRAWKYPLPGDKEIAMIHRCIIDVENAKVTMLQVAPDPHRASLSDDISSSGTFDDVDWSADSKQLAFVSTSRDHKNEKVRIADASTGAVRELFEETVKTQYESGWGAINWRYLQKTNELIWFSERDNWGHLYLYDAATGKLKNQITKGDWLVSKIVKVDEKTRNLYFIAHGLVKENPYFKQLCKIGFNGKGFTVLTPEPADHTPTLSPDNNYIVDSYSKPDVPPVTVLRSLGGKRINTLEKADVSRLVAAGWHAPIPFSTKAADGKTDVYGMMFTPAKMEAGKKYPVIDYIYPGPQGGSVRSWSFSAARGDNQALAELGFVVVILEGTSNPLRSKSFHDMSYGNMSENTIPDQISCIKQLAAKYGYLDTDKVGIWGHSGGGFATATAMFRYPDFFKVGIAESGNHDNRLYEDDWGERYNGLAENVDYEAQANQNYAKNLKGKLMLVHGMMDNNVPPQNTLLVAEALERAGKSFDLVIFPNSPHGYGPYSYYMMRRRWDYFVKNLMGKEHPVDYQLKAKTDPRNAGFNPFEL